MKTATDTKQDRVVDTTIKVEPTTEGRYKVRTAVLLTQFDVTAKALHALHGFHYCTPFCDCDYALCKKNLTLIRNTRLMLEKV